MAITASVAVLNQSTVLTDAEVQAALPAFQHQSNYHFAAHYHTGARLHFATDLATVPMGMWRMMILDDAEEAGYLGYHDLTEAGTPDALIFAKTDAIYGLSWTVTFTHELLELLGDAWINTANQVSDDTFYALEVCDPVEADEDGYQIKLGDHTPVLVSNFVLPKWFQPGAKAAKYDWVGLCKQPLELRPGGYQILYKDGKGWGAIYNQHGQEVDISHLLTPPTGESKRPRPSQAIRHAAQANKTMREEK